MRLTVTAVLMLLTDSLAEDATLDIALLSELVVQEVDDGSDAVYVTVMFTIGIETLVVFGICPRVIVV